MASRSVDVRETALPGVGVRHDFTTEAGRHVGLISYRSGRREVLFYDGRDPDAVSQSLELSADEAEALAALLGATRITRELFSLPQQVEGLVVEWLRLPPTSSFAGRTLGDTQARTRTGASVVAIVREGQVRPSPAPEVGLLGGDVLVVVGTPQGLEAVTELLEL
ncbi:MAG: putative regulatory ligand binding protein C-terminal domain of channel like protein [Frankiales bacterium]|nr:putative regulatory ligand binding protein C-terminal domain of channel like protein [Frankiales bacterium]